MRQRDKEVDLARRLQAAPVELAVMKELLDISLDGVKDKLLTCPSDEIAELRGEGRAYMALKKVLEYRDLNKPTSE